MNILIKLLPILFLVSCSFAPDYKRPQFDMPSFWNNKEKQIADDSDKQIIITDWWMKFNDPTLVNLVEEGLKNNTDLLTAASRVSEARAILSGNEINLYPELGVQAGASRKSVSAETSTKHFTTNPKPYNDFNLAAVLNYEIDLWGKLHNSSRAARAQLIASAANRDAVRLAIAAEIANGYFNWLALNKQIKVTEHTIKTRQETYDYQEKQYNLGAVDILLFRENQAGLAAAQALLPSLEQARQEQKTALAILLGREPEQIVIGDIEDKIDIDELLIEPLLPQDLPSALIERRPDIQAAEQNLIAANANIGVVRADYFPSLSLSALIGLDSSLSNKLLRSSAKYWDIGASAAAPLIDFGRRSSAVKAAEARKEQAIINYQSVVRGAFKEVIDAITAEQNTHKIILALKVEVKAYREVSRINNARFEAGYSDYLTFLESERLLLQSQLDEITAKRDQLSAIVTLYKALGGGWENNGIDG